MLSGRKGRNHHGGSARRMVTEPKDVAERQQYEPGDDAGSDPMLARAHSLCWCLLEHSIPFEPRMMKACTMRTFRKHLSDAVLQPEPQDLMVQILTFIGRA
eukprot:757757-Hanusia_phi.AAC.7